MTKKLEKESRNLADLRVVQARQNAVLSSKEKEAKRLSEEEEHKKRKDYWTKRNSNEKKEDLIDARSREIIDSAASFVSNTQRSFGVESGDFFFI